MYFFKIKLKKDAIYRVFKTISVLFFFFLSLSSYATLLNLPSVSLEQIKQKYGEEGLMRVEAWEALINDNQNIGELHKLRVVNDFFNQLPSGSDIKLWGQANYWETPVEFLGRGRGNCKDYALAKYFTLKMMGVSVDKMRLVYVVSRKIAGPHMILAYYETPDADPLILDNLTNWILYGSERPDLTPVYMLNGKSLWVVLKNSSQREITAAQNYSIWADVISRMQNEGMPKEMIE